MTRSTNMEHVEVLRHMKETIKSIMPSEVAALDAAIASLSATAEAQPVAWMTGDLLPCPFCGGQPYMQSDSDVDGCYWSKVRCRSCGATTRGKWASSSDSTCPQWYAEVREEWNARAVAEYNVKERDAEIEALRAEVERLKSMTAMTMGVGSGDGSLFVHGDYDSIKAAQALVFRAERLAEALRYARRFLRPEDHDTAYVDAALRDHDQEVGNG